MYKLFLTLRYLRKRRIAYFAIAAVTLCTAMVLIVMSVMGGFLDELKKRARGLLGDVIVDNRAYQGFPLYQEFIDEVRLWPEIVEATPVIYTFGLIRFPQTDQNGTARIVGIRLPEAYRVNAFRQSLFYERHFPESTTLGEQRQPALGLTPDPSAPEGFRFALPEPLQSALSQTWAAGIRDDDSAETLMARELRNRGQAHIPGVFELNTAGREPGFIEDARPGLIIGRDIVAKRLSDGKYERFSAYPRGCLVTLTLWPISVVGTVDPIPIRQPFRYADDSRTGIYEIDSQHVYCDFELLQRLLEMNAAERVEGGIAPGRCSQIQIKTAEGVNAKEVAGRLQSRYHAFLTDSRFDLSPTERRLVERIEALTWEESQAHVIGPVEKERFLVTILFAIISLVAIVLLLCILYMIVLQKTRDIGILKSIGGTSGGVALIFVTYGAAVGVVGSALGSFLGYWFVRKINEFQDFLIWAFQFQMWDRSVYSFDRIPSQVETADMIAVIACAILASTIGAFAAAWRAGTMQPVEALRYE